MKSLETYLPSAGGETGKQRLESLVLDDWKPTKDGDLHPLVERDPVTEARLEAQRAIEKASTNVRDLQFDVPLPEVEKVLDKPGLDPVVTDPVPAVVTDPNLVNPNQYASGVPMLRRGVREATPMSEDGLNELRTVHGSTVHGRGNIGTMGDLTPGRDMLLEAKYSGVATSAKTVRPVKEDTRFIEAAGSDLLKTGLKGDWETAREIVAGQQSGEGLSAFRGRVIRPEDEWKRKQVEGRASLVKSSDEGLGIFQTAPAAENRRLKPAPGKAEKMAELQEEGLRIIMELRQRIQAERKPFTTELLSLDLDINDLRSDVSAEKDETKLAAKKKVLAGLESRRSALHKKLTEPSPTEEALKRAEATYRRNFGDIE